MFISCGPARLELAQGDITRQTIDAIVNAANSSLAGGGGVDGAIHRAGGPLLLRQTRERYPGGCPTGSAVATDAGRLAARFVFHAVGPVWRGGGEGEPELLASAYRRCFELARELDCAGIAFPAISARVYGYPKDLAAEVSLAVACAELRRHQRPLLVRFVLLDAGTYGTFARALEAMKA